jgi:hypothetical protein
MAGGGLVGYVSRLDPVSRHGDKLAADEECHYSSLHSNKYDADFQLESEIRKLKLCIMHVITQERSTRRYLVTGGLNMWEVSMGGSHITPEGYAGPHIPRHWFQDRPHFSGQYNNSHSIISYTTTDPDHLEGFLKSHLRIQGGGMAGGGLVEYVGQCNPSGVMWEPPMETFHRLPIPVSKQQHLSFTITERYSISHSSSKW